MKNYLWLLIPLLSLGCSEGEQAKEEVRLEEIASSERQWTGITISGEGRMFVNFPRWPEEVPVSVAETKDGKPYPYPNERWNNWAAGKNPDSFFVCVQSVVADDGFLWVLDPANPQFGGVIEQGPRLHQFSLETDTLVRTYTFSEDNWKANSYFNDVRIDAARQFAYITDSGDGAIVVLNLADGSARRLLDEHPSTQAEDIVLTIGGEKWLRPDGSQPQVHSDGIALSANGAYLYYQALTGRTLYSIDTEYLRDTALYGPALWENVEEVAKSGPADGIMFGEDGNIYLSALEDNAIKRLTPAGEVETVIQDERIKWPDTFAKAPNGDMYFTTAQIHLPPEERGEYKIFKIVNPMEPAKEPG